MTLRRVVMVTIALVVTVFSGCTLGVEPWERDLLAEESMQFDTNPARNGNDDHIYFSKESSSGGRGFGGGGCGCN